MTIVALRSMSSLHSEALYLQRQKYRKSSRKEATFDEDLQTNWLTKEEFKQKYRMDRENFYKVVEKIEKHPIFNDNNQKGRKQISVHQQMMVFLKYVAPLQQSNVSKP